jgi:hypothetical protein
MQPSRIITFLVWLTIGLLTVGSAAYVTSYFMIEGSWRS